MREILDEIKYTNQLLVKVEAHLYNLTLPPDLKMWSEEKKKGPEGAKEYNDI